LIRESLGSLREFDSVRRPCHSGQKGDDRASPQLEGDTRMRHSHGQGANCCAGFLIPSLSDQEPRSREISLVPRVLGARGTLDHQWPCTGGLPVERLDLGSFVSDFNGLPRWRRGARNFEFAPGFIESAKVRQRGGPGQSRRDEFDAGGASFKELDRTFGCSQGTQ
jgi:hypothetical protein